jgi:DHA2 family multidrug resistance protein
MLAPITMPRELNNDGAALFAMFRNVFGSTDISLATAAITERTQVHQPNLSQWQTHSINLFKR